MQGTRVAQVGRPLSSEPGSVWERRPPRPPAGSLVSARVQGCVEGAGAVAPGPSGGGEHPLAPLACWALRGPAPHLWERLARGRSPASGSQRVPVRGAASSERPTQGCHDCFSFGNQFSAGGNPAPFLPFSRPKLAVMDSEGRTCGAYAGRRRGRGSRPRAFDPPSLPTPFSSHVGFHRAILTHAEMGAHAPSLSSRPKLDTDASSASLKPF